MHMSLNPGMEGCGAGRRLVLRGVSVSVCLCTLSCWKYVYLFPFFFFCSYLDYTIGHRHSLYTLIYMFNILELGEHMCPENKA